jgi:hypothetical protein
MSQLSSQSHQQFFLQPKKHNPKERDITRHAKNPNSFSVTESVKQPGEDVSLLTRSLE